MDEDIEAVVGKLAKVIDPDKIMIVGARSRDILQRTFRNTPTARATHDIDFAVAIESREEFDRLREEFPGGRDWHRINVDGMPIDVVPFGEVEDSPGKFRSGDDHELNVAGFRETFSTATIHPLGSGQCIRLPTVAGLAGLKLHAWLDRSGSRTYKDANDLALILAWIEEADSLWDRYPEDDRFGYLGEPDAMAAVVLGSDIGREWGKEATGFLLGRCGEEGDTAMHLLSEKLVAPGEHEHPLERRVLQVEALLQGLTSMT